MTITHRVVVFDAADLDAESRFWVEDFEEAPATVMSLGARVLQPAEDGPAPEAFQVNADPAGHPFCLCWITSS